MGRCHLARIGPVTEHQVLGFRTLSRILYIALSRFKFYGYHHDQIIVLPPIETRHEVVASHVVTAIQS